MLGWDLSAPHQRLPVSLLTGFLGSGKTTVLNHLVCHSALKRTLVIINEFGEIGLDHEIAALIQRLNALNPSAPIIHTINGAVEPAKILDAGLYNPKTKSLDVRRWLNAEAFNDVEPHETHGDHNQKDGVPHSADHDHGHHHDVNRHGDHIKALCLTLDDPIPGNAFDRWLEALLLLKGPDVLRVKGIVNIQGLKGPLVIHGVQHIFHPPVMLKKWPREDRRTRIVFIARDLDESILRDTLKMFSDAEAERREVPLNTLGDGNVARLEVRS